MKKFKFQRALSLLILVPAGLVLVIFAVVNRHLVPLDFWPLPISVLLPFSVAIMLVFVIGVLWGGIVSWISAFNSRRQAREVKRKAIQAEFQLRHLKDRIRALEAEVQKTKQVIENEGVSESFRPSLPQV